MNHKLFLNRFYQIRKESVNNGHSLEDSTSRAIYQIFGKYKTDLKRFLSLISLDDLKEIVSGDPTLVTSISNPPLDLLKLYLNIHPRPIFIEVEGMNPIYDKKSRLLLIDHDPEVVFRLSPPPSDSEMFRAISQKPFAITNCRIFNGKWLTLAYLLADYELQASFKRKYHFYLQNALDEWEPYWKHILNLPKKNIK